MLSKVVSLSTVRDISNVRRNVKGNVEVHITNLLLILSVTKKFWSCIKSKKNDHCGIKVDGNVVNNPQQKAEILNDYFSFKEDSSSGLCSDENSFADMPPIDVCNDGVLKLFLDLQPYKASGPDKIPTRLLKEIAFAITPVLTLLIQASLDHIVR